MNKLTLALGVASFVCTASSQANTLLISGQINADTVANTTTIDQWKFDIQATGNMSVDVLAYEASQNNIATAGYQAVDVNNDGEQTWLDADTQWWHDNTALTSSDAIIRCDDIQNNCPKYAGATSLNSSTVVAGLPISVASHLTSETSADGSVFKRDPWYDATFSQTGSYLFVIGQYYSKYSEVISGVHSGAFSPPSGYSAPILDHADYRVSFSSDTLNFSLNGNVITVTAVPVPGAMWLFGSALLGLMGFRAKRG